MKEYVSIGKNVDIAIEDGLRALGLGREDVDIKILETGGLFKKAKVCLIYEEKQPQPVIETQTKEETVEQVIETVETEETVEQVIEDAVEEVVNKTEETTKNSDIESEKQPKEVKMVSPDALKERVTNFLMELANKMKLEVQVNCEINENDLNFEVTGQNVGKLIGFRGETLSALQTLLGGLKRSGEGRYRIYLDIENYKKAREQTLVDLANKMADKAEEIERNVHLDPMSAYERRIVHSALQNRELVETESMGEGEKRHVVIKFKR